MAGRAIQPVIEGKQSPSKHIIIAGDAPVRLFLYPPDPGPNQDSRIQRPHAYWHRVGVELLAEFLQEALKAANPPVHVLKPNIEHPLYGTVHSILELETIQPCVPQQRQAFKAKRIQQVGTKRKWHLPTVPNEAWDNLPVVVFQETKTESQVPDDNANAAIKLFEKCRPIFLIYHMAYYLCRGRIWNHVRRGPLVSTCPAAEPERDTSRLIIVVDADDLRAEGIQLSHGLSWEKTCEDFVNGIGSVGELVSLTTSAHLIVLFDCAGAIYHQGAQVAKPILFFDPLSIEGQVRRTESGYIPGVSDAFLAGFTQALARSSEPNIPDGINFGLRAARRLTKLGLARPDPTSAATFPETSLANVYRTEEVFKINAEGQPISFDIPANTIIRGSEPNWSLLDYTVGDPAELAREIVKKGVLFPPHWVPLAKFGQLVLFDRREIESFRTIYSFIEESLLNPSGKPICIALFGPKGSGKAFSARQVAESVPSDREKSHLRFNLTQFSDVGDLLVAFHEIRDSYLAGSMPFVYFSGFDTNLAGSPLGWLPHLLPVMFSGSFSDGGISRPIGFAVFFLGSTVFPTYEDLRRKTAQSVPGTGNAGHAQEFLSCLHGFVNILGPNKADIKHGVMDRLYPVRRAVILRHLLENSKPQLMAGNEIKIDDKVLNALLLVPIYRQGIRSLKSIIAMSALNGRYSFELASLPPKAQLDLHVDQEEFLKFMNGIPLPTQLREDLAEKIHNEYLKKRREMVAEGVYQKPTDTEERVDISLEPWPDLSQEFKESSRAHADSIPFKLRQIKCFLAETQDGRKHVSKFSDEETNLMAKIEHDRWNAEKLQNQWGQGKERDARNRRTPFLTPWSDMEDMWRDVDRALVRSYPNILPDTHKIYRFGPRS